MFKWRGFYLFWKFGDLWGWAMKNRWESFAFEDRGF